MNDTQTDITRTDDTRAHIRQRLGSLSSSEARVARYLADHAEQALLLSAAQVAELAGTSDTTVVRTARSLGYSGWSDLRRAFGAEITKNSHPAARLTTRLKVTKHESTQSLIHTVFDEARDRLEISRDDVDAAAFERAVDHLVSAGTVHTFGVGVSALCASYLAIKLTRLDIKAREATGMGFTFADDLMRLSPGDALVLFAPGRSFRELDVAFDEAERVGVPTVLFTGLHRHQYDDRADAVIRCAGSAGGLTGDTLSALVAADALLLAVSHRGSTSARDASRRLNRLRRELRRGTPTS